MPTRYPCPPTPVEAGDDALLFLRDETTEKGRESMIPTIPVSERLSLHDVAQEIGKSYITTFRWATSGNAGIILKNEWVGGRRYTCRAWLNEFLSAVGAARNAALTPHPAPPSPPPARGRRRKGGPVHA